ncbi:MAG: DoxX family membrane protein [Anaerolineae bacterium]|nr:DoxX family membrane protein [Anaerolineae bacterium]
MNRVKSLQKNRVINDPPIVRFLFGDARAAWLWLPLRIWLGYQWISSSLTKVTNPAWMDGGQALRGFWQAAVAIPEQGRPSITFDWYRGFIQMLLDTQSYTWFAKLVAFGELLVGVALILGAFTGIAAIFGAFMNWNFMMAGAASTNPMLIVIAFGLILAWKVAGLIGADFVLLPLIGTPWGREKKEPKSLFSEQAATTNG